MIDKNPHNTLLQLDLFRDEQAAAYERRIVKTINTDLGDFGNRTDIIVVDESTVRGASLLECADSDVQYFNNQSRLSDAL